MKDIHLFLIIVGAALIIGLLLRYGKDTAGILGVAGNQGNHLLSTLALTGQPGNA